MLDNNPSDLPPPPNALPAPIKRYAPPNQRNRSLNRRKSGDRLEKTNSLHGNDADKNNTSAAVCGGMSYDVGCSNSFNGSSYQRLIPLDGCSRSDASKLLQSRWEEAICSYNDPKVDLAERPTMYTSTGGPAWVGRLPHQLVSRNEQMDFLAELRRQRQNHNTHSKP